MKSSITRVLTLLSIFFLISTILIGIAIEFDILGLLVSSIIICSTTGIGLMIMGLWKLINGD